MDDLTAIILDRPRNRPHIEAVRRAGARIQLIRDGDIAAAIAAATGASGIDLLLGIGGSPEAVTAACALRCLGGAMQCRLWPRDEAERDYAADAGLDLAQVLTLDDLVRGGEVFFAATGVTHGELLDGVRYVPGGAWTHTVVMRSHTGTVRYITAHHRFDRLSRITDIYGAGAAGAPPPPLERPARRPGR